MAVPFTPLTAQDAYAITKSDTTVLQNPFAALYVGTTGDVAVKTSRGNTVTFSSVPAGAVIPISGNMVLSTGTSASGIVGLVY